MKRCTYSGSRLRVQLPTRYPGSNAIPSRGARHDAVRPWPGLSRPSTLGVAESVDDAELDHAQFVASQGGPKVPANGAVVTPRE
jgi:hypothetical protein